MELTTTRFGVLEIDADSVITFTQPIIGFEEYRRFVLLPGPEGSFVNWLQSVESGELAFLLMNPRDVLADYEVTPHESELSELAAAGPDELDVYSLVVVPQDPAQVRTNLKAPILINPRHRLGKQTVLDTSTYPIQFFLAQARRESQKPEQVEEVSNARSDA